MRRVLVSLDKQSDIAEMASVLEALFQALHCCSLRSRIEIRHWRSRSRSRVDYTPDVLQSNA